ncbi:AraC family transcriptional regulator [Clostridium oryzae]|uniref:HTH-type transcriptional activator Btr n=1 Tax=Clostridium oryzae TaxID=1450648 RepID=A0A1V4IN22_9CLOT|nr:AraC family transcriptional regulator [Clostridium oryzae]OPJ61200.1 HTH-type transcriptional activator Btr [Clostridium oryzae]
MRYSDYNEIKQRGTFNFPIEFHYVDKLHPRYMMSYHWHIEYEIIRILKGELVVELNQKQFVAKEGDVIFIRDGILHAGIPKDCVYECIVFNVNMLLKENYSGIKYIQDIIDHNILVNDYFPNVNSELHNTIHKLFEAMEAKREGYELITLGTLYQVLGLIYEAKLYTVSDLQPQKDSKKILQLKKVLKVIEASYSSQLALEDLSRVVGMSRKYFCNFFYEMTHRTPIDYVNYYRIECASIQLVSTSLSITEIAYNCGFNDLSYFIRAFKKYKGITPSRYSKQNRNGATLMTSDK